MTTPTVFSFGKQMAVGKLGEEQVMSWLQAQGWKVDDCRASRYAQRMDIDFVISSLTDIVVVELKTDTHAPKNLFLETEVDGKPGYIFKTRAEVLLYYFPRESRLYWIPMPQLLQHLWNYGMALEERIVQNPRYTCTGVLLPLERILHFTEVYDLSAKQEAA